MKWTSATDYTHQYIVVAWPDQAPTGIIATIKGFINTHARPEARPAAGALARSANMFAQALHEDSNQVMDWLWYATQMCDDTKRRFCIQRALAINPDSELAKRALAELSPAAPEEKRLFNRVAERTA